MTYCLKAIDVKSLYEMKLEAYCAMTELSTCYSSLLFCCKAKERSNSLYTLIQCHDTGQKVAWRVKSKNGVLTFVSAVHRSCCNSRQAWHQDNYILNVLVLSIFYI